MVTKFKGQRQWVREVLKKFEDSQTDQPSGDNKDPEWPEWVDNLWKTLLGIPYPGSKIRDVKKWKAKDLGRFMGRHCAWEHLMVGQVPLSAKVIEEGEAFFTWAEKRAKQLNPKLDMQEIQTRSNKESKARMRAFRRFLQETLASVCERPYHESCAFFEAFGKAIVMKPDDLLTERTMGVGDKICWTMIAMWQEINGLKSVGELHRLFEKGLKPQGIVVGHKRMEKLCQRIKLKFRDPGRPQGSKNSDKSPRSLGVY